MSIGFKEWALICEALGGGVQSIILRKGGIAEGRAGFRFQHEKFLLFPTLFHEQAIKLKTPVEGSLPAERTDGLVEIHYRARVEWTEDITSLELAHRLGPFHVWHDEVVEERFRYKDEGKISLAFVRVEKLSAPFVFPDLPRYGGCRSWVELPEVPAETTFTPVLDEGAHRSREHALREVLAEWTATAASI